MSQKMYKSSIKALVVLCIILLAVVCIVVALKFGDEIKWNKWFKETEPQGQYYIMVEKNDTNSPVALRRKTSVRITISDSKTDNVIQQFETNTTKPDKDGFSFKYDEKGISIFIHNNDKEVENAYYFSYDSLSQNGRNVKGVN